MQKSRVFRKCLAVAALAVTAMVLRTSEARADDDPGLECSGDTVSSGPENCFEEGCATGGTISNPYSRGEL